MLWSRLSYLSLLALVAVRLARAQDFCDNTDCSINEYCLCPQCADTLQCAVCGYQGAEPLRCEAFNAVSRSSETGFVDGGDWQRVLVSRIIFLLPLCIPET